ncbi:MAG: hypothetical protein QOH05_4260 [Acetobacteraceae bacterium]|jgi:hypothetical protein|nr:hypothetical protein [Acetobacteraceae bacterium]
MLELVGPDGIVGVDEVGASNDQTHSQKFEDATRAFDRLGTNPGFGYRWRDDG